MYFDKYGTFERYQALVSNANKEDWQPVSGLVGVRINVQPASTETTAISEGYFGKTYTVFTTHSGIKEGDRLTVSGTFTDGTTINKQIFVRDVGKWDFVPLRHFEITCVEKES